MERYKTYRRKYNTVLNRTVGMDAKLTNEKSVKDLPPIDRHGKPTTYLSYMILKIMFAEHRRWFTPEDLSELLAARYNDTDSICRQLKQADLLSEESSRTGYYQYNLNTQNVDLQTKLENYLAEVELYNLPVHLILDYSPSFRFRERSKAFP